MSSNNFTQDAFDRLMLFLQELRGNLFENDDFNVGKRANLNFM